MINPHGKPAGDIAKNHCNHAGSGRPAYEYDVRPRHRSELELDNMRQLTLNRYGIFLLLLEELAASLLNRAERMTVTA